MIPGVTFPQTKPVKVFQCIPNIGHTEPLAYDNRLVANQRLGAREERARWLHWFHGEKSWVELEEAGRIIEAVTGTPYDRAVAEHRTWYEFYTFTVGEVLTPYARELLIERGLELGCDLFYMIDDDMIGDPDTFFRLAESVVHGPADIVAALAFTRGTPHRPVLYRQLSGYDAQHKKHVTNRAVERYPKNALVECDAVGFGAVVFRAEMAKAIPPPRFMNTTGSGEDIYFCYKARETTNARVFCDTRVKLGHMGYKPVITEETYESQPEMQTFRDRHGTEIEERVIGPEAPTWAAVAR